MVSHIQLFLVIATCFGQKIDHYQATYTILKKASMLCIIHHALCSWDPTNFQFLQSIVKLYWSISS
jgi:hypothetical protein